MASPSLDGGSGDGGGGARGGGGEGGDLGWIDGIVTLEGRLASGCSTSDRLDDASLRAEALSLIPLAALHSRRDASPHAGDDPHDGLLRELLRWFKFEFFKWVTQPECDFCGSSTKSLGSASPSADDLAGGAGRVELYECKACARHVRFPRYNDPRRLMRTRRGRCGEWANVFTLFCRALGFVSRYVLDVTDHVWTEVWSAHRGRWLHADPCENKLDAPLMYCLGWKKQLRYIFAFGPGEVADVIARYVDPDSWAGVRGRRTECSEAWVSARITALAASRSASARLSPHELSLLGARQRAEALELACPARPREQPQEQEPPPDYAKPALRGWAAGVATTSGVVRAEEEDWNMVYLARTQGVAEAAVEWAFRCEAGARIVGGRALLVHSLHDEAAKVRWRLSRDDGVTWRTLGVSGESAVELKSALGAVDARGNRSAVEKNDGCRLLRLRAELSGGSWQAAQLFRQSRALLDVFGLDVQLLLAVEPHESCEPAVTEAVRAPEPVASPSAVAADAAAEEARAQFVRLFAQVAAEERFRDDPSGAAAEALRRTRM